MSKTQFLTELVTKVKPNINSVEFHPQLSNNGHPVDGALVVGGPTLLPPCLVGIGRKVSIKLSFFSFF
jgi:hypothetical protein